MPTTVGILTIMSRFCVHAQHALQFMQRFDSVIEKDFNLQSCTRNQNYIQSIESDCRNKVESLSSAHSYLDA